GRAERCRLRFRGTDARGGQRAWLARPGFCLSVAYGLPYPHRGEGRVEVADAERRERVDYGVPERADRPGGSRFTDSLGAEWVHRCRGDCVSSAKRWEFGRRWHGIVDEGRREGVAGVVVADLFEQHLGDALG